MNSTPEPSIFTGSPVNPSSPSPARPSLAGPALVYGFGTAIALWCIWFVLHLPGIALAPAIAGPLLLGCQLLAAVIAGIGITRSLGPEVAIRAGLFAGIVAAGLNLLLLGSTIDFHALSSDPSNGWVAPRSLAIAIPGFLAVGAGLGALGGAIGRVLVREAPNGDLQRATTGRPAAFWLARFAIVAAVAFLPLLVAGGLVTSTQSGMAVPDWPTTKGMNMFLYPLGAMTHPRVRIEHMHRLLGSMVGLTTLTLMIYVLRVESRRWVKVWAVGLFLCVGIQGVLGGLRVIQNKPVMAMVHGIFAQIVFALAVALAAYLTSLYRAAPPTIDGDRKRRAFATGLLHALLLQLALGAAYRHLGHKHIAFTHAAFAVVVLIMAIFTGLLAMKRLRQPDGSAQEQLPAGRALNRLGRILLGIVFLQFALGWVVLLLVMTDSSRGAIPTADQLATAAPVPIARTLAATAHQTNGALLLGTATLLAVFCRRLCPRSARKS